MLGWAHHRLGRIEIVARMADGRSLSLAGEQCARRALGKISALDDERFRASRLEIGAIHLRPSYHRRAKNSSRGPRAQAGRLSLFLLLQY